MNEQRVLTEHMAALIFDQEDETFKLALPSVEDKEDDRMPIQVLALIGLMLRLNKDQAWVEELLNWSQTELAAGIPPEFQASIGAVGKNESLIIQA